MSEKLSGFVEENLKNTVEDARQNEINRLYDQRRALVASGKPENDPEVLALSQRLVELTGPRASDKFATKITSQFDGVLSSATDANSAQETQNDSVENLSAGMKFIKAEQKKIIDLRRSLLTEVWPQITNERFKSFIKGEIDKFDNDYHVFQQEVDWFDHKDDLTIVKEKFVGPFSEWYDRLHDIFMDAHRNIDNL